MRINSALSTAAIAFSLAAGSTPAGATTQRAFVATSGNDANASLNCSRVSPCRSFAIAIGVTDPGGSVVVLDSGGYGPVTITTAVAIIAPPGVHAAITATTGQPGIVVNAPDASVTLRGLYLEGKGIGSDGIQFNVRDNSALSVENVVVDGFAGNGLAMKRGVALEHSELVVQDSTFRNNGGSGIYLTNGDYFILFPRESILIENTRVTHNGYGIASDGGICAHSQQRGRRWLQPGNLGARGRWPDADRGHGNGGLSLSVSAFRYPTAASSKSVRRRSPTTTSGGRGWFGDR